jgi:probable rRNA maturation factor
MRQKVFFSYADSGLPLRNKTAVKQSVVHLFTQEGKTLDTLQYVFCTDAFLLTLNQQYLQHNTFTDIITFDLSTPDSGIAGEIYISVERVRENSAIHNTRWEEEILRVIYHGALHLCGYRDKKKAEQALMRSKEDFYLQQYLR